METDPLDFVWAMLGLPVNHYSGFSIVANLKHETANTHRPKPKLRLIQGGKSDG